MLQTNAEPPLRAPSVAAQIFARAAGYSLAELAAEAGLMPSQVSNGSVAYDDGMALWNALERLRADPYVGHRLGATLSLSRGGVFGPLLAHSADLRAALQAATSALALVFPAGRTSWEEIPGRGFEVRYRRPDSRLRSRHGVESAFAAFVSLARQAVAEEFPCDVALASSMPADRAVFDDFYRGQVTFGAAEDRLLFPAAVLSRSLPGSAPEVAELVARNVPGLLGADTLIEKVTHTCRAAIESGDGSIEEVSRRMGIGPRTLQRRLSDEGRSFRELRDGVARAIAQNMLRGDDSIEDIATRLGFSSRAGFDRAFRRWHGQTPASWRRQNRGAPH